MWAITEILHWQTLNLVDKRQGLWEGLDSVSSQWEVVLCTIILIDKEKRKEFFNIRAKKEKLQSSISLRYIVMVLHNKMIHSNLHLQVTHISIQNGLIKFLNMKIYTNELKYLCRILFQRWVSEKVKWEISLFNTNSLKKKCNLSSSLSIVSQS